MLLRRLPLAAILALVTPPLVTPSAAEPAPAPAPAPLIGGLSPVDAAFDIRLDLLLNEKSPAAAFAFVSKEFARDPRPHVQARYAEFLIEGHDWGAPDGMAEQGIALAREARGKGSLHALRIIGWDLVTGRHSARNPALGVVFLRQAATAGNANAMISLGDVYLRGIGVPVDLTSAEAWFLRAAWQGKPHSLFRLAEAYEHLTPPNPAKAAMLCYEAASRGSGSAWKHLEERVAQNDPAATRVSQLYLLSRAVLGADYTTKKVRTALAGLETNYPQDPLALLAVGRLYASGRYVTIDLKKARACFERAAALGSDDAQADLAQLYAEGRGVPKDPDRAVATWRELAAKDNACALAWLGYYSYWGSLGADHLPKDAAQAFAYCVRAADLGDVHGQCNAGACHEFGIGTPVDYALAAHYYRSAAWRGERRSNEQLPKLLRAVLR